MRILLVEDRFLVAHELRWLLQQLGCAVVGPAPTVEEGLRLAQQEYLDGAILDVNIVGGTCEPIAQELRQRSCPFFLVTGYASPQLPDEVTAAARMLRKPVTIQSLREAIRAEIGERS